MSKRVPITVAHGDGIGPEIMEATLQMLEAAGARIEPETIQIGLAAYQAGYDTGLDDNAWESLRRTRVFLKAPVTTPQGGGFKSLNVTVRKTLSLFANVRPNIAMHPFVQTHHPGMNVVIVRENEEDLYAGIEYRQTDDVYQCLKLFSRPGTERIIRYAFEYARANGRKKVTCMSKDNIMKMTDGLYHRIFKEIGEEYPEIEQDHWIIDIGSALIAQQPERFDVVVTSNLYGDIISDIAAQVAGSVGMAGSANVGASCAMFEAIHGSAPDIAGKGIANPSGLLNGALMMLAHIGQSDVASLLHDAWLKTIEDGYHTGDIASESHTKVRCNTKEFASAVIERLGEKPSTLPRGTWGDAGNTMKVPEASPSRPQKKELIGVDVFLQYNSGLTSLLGALEPLKTSLTLKEITNRGVEVWPSLKPETRCSDHWRCRFVSETTTTPAEVLALLQGVDEKGLEFVKTENLYTFDGEIGFSGER